MIIVDGGKILQRLSCMVPLATSLQGLLCYNCLLWCGKRLSVDVSRTGVTTTTNLAFQRWGLLQIASIPRCDWARFMGSLPMMGSLRSTCPRRRSLWTTGMWEVTCLAANRTELLSQETLWLWAASGLLANAITYVCPCWSPLWWWTSRPCFPSTEPLSYLLWWVCWRLGHRWFSLSRESRLSFDFGKEGTSGISSGAFRCFKKAKEIYAQQEILGSDDKDQINCLLFKAAGAEVDSRLQCVNDGLVSVSAPASKRLGLASLRLWNALYFRCLPFQLDWQLGFCPALSKACHGRPEQRFQGRQQCFHRSGWSPTCQVAQGCGWRACCAECSCSCYQLKCRCPLFRLGICHRCFKFQRNCCQDENLRGCFEAALEECWQKGGELAFPLKGPDCFEGVWCWFWGEVGVLEGGWGWCWWGWPKPFSPFRLVVWVHWSMRRSRKD